MNAVTSWLDTMAATRKWHSTLRSRAPQAAVWALAVAIGVQAAVIVTRWAGSGGIGVTAVAQSTAAAQPPIDIAEIASQHLFGAPPAVSEGGSGAPRTDLALVLTGTIAATLPQNGLAILGANPAAVKVYAVGDNVPGGARLHAVYDDRVLLDRGGRLESLMLVRGIPAGEPNLGPATAPVQQAVARVRRLMDQDPGALENIMRPQPVFTGGKLRGYRVYPGRNVRAFSVLGLRPGDLVIAIDGTPLDDPSRGEEIFRTLGSSSEAHVTVERNGQQQDLLLNMSQIASQADQLTDGENGAGGASAPAPQGPAGDPGND
jgi:general secretion pathway protein C